MAEPQETGVVTMDKIVSLCRRRGFVFPSSEIYGGLGSTFDYGHYGVLAKNNIRERWFQAMVQQRDDIVALDSAVILHPRVWEASGHVEGFTDPLVDCRTCKLRFRADKLDEEQCGRKPSRASSSTSRTCFSSRAGSRRSVLHRLASHSGTRSRLATSSSASESSNRWRWSTSFPQSRRMSGIATGSTS